jgi:16S rRNA (guanine527-N7)-methyltransferase
VLKGLNELGLPQPDSCVNAFMLYLSELKRWNKAYNLTGLKRDEDIIIRHFLDSLLYLNVIPDTVVTVADVGSGAGFPGIPVKIVRPGIEMFLIEPSAKKSAFLRHIIHELRLENISVIEKRIEDIQANRDILPVDVALTRALFSIKDFMKQASHIVRAGGILILSKGPKVNEELQTIPGSRIQVITSNLPLTDIQRFLVVVQLE